MLLFLYSVQLHTEVFPVGGRFWCRKPMLGCLFHGSTSAAVLEAMPSLRVHQQTLQRALALDYDWRAHDIFVTHNNPSTEKPKVTLKEVSRLHTRTQPQGDRT